MFNRDNKCTYKKADGLEYFPETTGDKIPRACLALPSINCNIFKIEKEVVFRDTRNRM